MEQKKFKISIFDVIILAVVLLAAAAVLLVFRPGKATVTAPTGTPTEYTVELAKMPAGSGELVQAGDSVSDGARNYAIGTVVSAETVPYTYQSTDETTGTVQNVPLDRYENVRVTIRANLSPSSKGLATADGYVVTVGTQVHLSGPCYAGTGYVIAIERGE